MFDTHLHTMFSGDSDTEPPLHLKKAKELNLDGIIFTDHIDIDFKMEPGLFDLNIPAYTTYISELINKESSDDFYIGLGLEFGLQSHLKDNLDEIAENYEFDFILGSLHGIDGVDPYYDAFFDGYDVKERYREYFEYTLKNINIHDGFDSLGHLDYALRYGNDYCLRNGLAVVDFDEREVIYEILKTLIKKDKCLEVNTGAFRAGLKEPNPSYDIIKSYYEFGGRMITIGSDAHRTEHVGLKFDEVCEALKDIGFKYQMVYKKRIPHEFKL